MEFDSQYGDFAKEDISSEKNIKHKPMEINLQLNTNTNILDLQKYRNKVKYDTMNVNDKIIDLFESKIPLESKLDQIRKEKQSKELDGMTFHPQINQKPNTSLPEREKFLDRTKEWNMIKVENQKRAMENKVNQSKARDDEVCLPLKLFESKVTATSKVKDFKASMEIPDMTKSVIYYNKGNYKADVPSRVQRKLKNYEQRKGQHLKRQTASQDKKKVNFGDFRVALHKKINNL